MTFRAIHARATTLGLAGLLVATVGIAHDVAGVPRSALAADPGPEPAFSLPAEADLVAGALQVVDDTPATRPDMVDPNPLLEQLSVALEALPEAAWEVPALAATLGNDPEAAFALVRDSIRFDPYAGVLRGAQGTLAARAGNAFDRALLLQALLAGMGVQARYAFGDLDPIMAARVVAHSFDPVRVPLATTTTNGLRGGAGDALAMRAARDYALLRASLGDRVATMSADTAADALADITRHAWVQVLRDGQWLDYDPTLADAVPGVGLVPATETVEEVPVVDRQTVTVRVVAETLEADGVYETVALEQVLDAAEAADRDILLYFQPDPAATEAGLLGGVGGLATLVPILSVGDAKTIGTAVPIGDAREDSGLGLGRGGTSGSLLSLRVELANDAPGASQTVSRRMLIDRVPRAARASGSVTVAQLLPVAMAGIVPVLLTNIHHVLVSTGGSDPRAQVLRLGDSTAFAAKELGRHKARTAYGMGAILSPMIAADRDIVLTSERAIVPGLEADGESRAFVARPRVYLVSMGPDEVDPSDASMRVDLALDSVRVLPAPGAEAGTAALRQIWYGALQTALETGFMLRASSILEPSSRRLLGASLTMDEQLTVLSASDAPDLPDGVPALLRRALEGGDIVVVAGEPADAQAWWTVATTDGTTRSILDPGGNSLMAAGAILSPGGYVVANPGVLVHWTAYEVEAQPRGGIESQLVTNLVAIESIATTEQIATMYVTLMRLVSVWLAAG